MCNEDLELIKLHPELNFKIEYLNDGKLNPRTIYGKMRLFKFRLLFLDNKENLSIESIIRKSNIFAIQYTWSTFINQYLPKIEPKYLSQEELEELLNKEN